MTVGMNILELRKKYKMSQEQLAEKMCVTRQTVSLWETDQTMPTLDNLLRLRSIFGVSADNILHSDEVKIEKHNSDSLDTICATLAYAMGIEAPLCAASKNDELANYIEKVFDSEKADRVFMYNPDAIAMWVYQKYPEYLDHVRKYSEKEIYLSTVMPSVTPVCFATMYTGAQPEVHGIQKYEKPVITIDTIFDRLIAAGKRVALITYAKCSL